MPCPDFGVSIMSRSAGKSAVASAAYQSCSQLFSDYDSKTKNYTYKWHELVHEEIMLPANAPPEYSDRQTLWNAVEAAEKSWNAQLARRMRFALPREVPPDQYVAMVREYCQEHFVSKGMICDFAIHDKGDGNPHVHVLLTLRSLDEQGRWCPKCKKEYVLDEEGQRIRLPSGEWKSRRVDVNDWNNKGNCEVWRHGWEVVQNKYLELNGRQERIDMRSYARQGIDQIPTVHMGPAVAAMEQKGIPTNIGNLNRDIKATNSLMQSIRNMIRGLKNWLSELSEAKQAIKEALAEMKEPTLPEILLQYFQIRQDERSTWSASGQLKGTVADYEKVTKASEYLRSHGIDTVDQMLSYLDELEKTVAGAKRCLKQNAKRREDIGAVKKADSILKKYKPVHDAYMKKGFKLTKERYYEAHKDEIDAYNRAYKLRKKVAGTTAIDHSALDAELRTLTASDAKAQATLDSVMADVEQMKNVRYYVSRVMPDKVEPKSLSEKLAVGKDKADRENDERKQQTPKRKQNMEL